MDDDPRGQRPLSPDESLRFGLHLAELVQGELPLPGGLRAMSRELPRCRLSRALVAVADELEAGRSLEEIVQSPRGLLPRQLRGLMVASIRSGRLGDVLERLLRYQFVLEDLRRSAWQVLAYPLVLLLMLAAILVFVLTFLVPQIENIFQDFGIGVPWATTAVLWLSRHGLGWMAGLATAFALAAILMAWLGMPPLVDRWVNRMPLIGPWRKSSALAEFSFVLGVLLEQSIPLPEALRLTAGGLRSTQLAKASDRLAEAVAGGQGLSAGLGASASFSRTLVPIARWGEEHHALPEALQTAGQMFARRAALQEAYLRQMVPPFIILFVATVLLFMVMALFGPLATLIQRLS